MSLSRTANKINSFSSFFAGRVKIIFVILGLLVINKAVLANSYRFDKSSPQYLPQEAEWCLPKGECLLLEVADTFKERSLGLMGRNYLAKGEGMLFKFPSVQIVGFWMKKTLFPLDIIFLYKNSIIAIEKNLQPCYLSPCPEYGPKELVDTVIELAAGEVDRLDVEVGDYVEVEFLDLSPRD